MAGAFAANPKRVVLLVIAVAVIAGVVGWAVGSNVQSPSDAAAERQPPPASRVTAPVERRTLKSAVVAQGTVAYGTPSPIQLTGTVGGIEGTQLITKAPAQGKTIREGDVLMEVSGRPVIVLAGGVPMYRTLGPGAKGDDVKQLQTALRALGYGVAVSGTFDQATAAAVQKMYGKAGYEAMATKADKPVTSVPSGEIVFLPKLPVRLDVVTAKAGAPATGQIGTVTDSTVVVQGKLPAADAKLLKAGMPATLRLPDGTEMAARLEALGKDASVTPPAAQPAEGDGKPAAQAPQDPGTDTPLRLSAADQAALAAFAGTAVKVTLEVGTTGGDVLTVPVAAVVTAADGSAHVRVEEPNGTLRDVPVALGLTALGSVQVSPEGAPLEAGDRVVVSAS
ncbi:peptidoglycan-binding domain-containing protein [Lentzea sp. NPDC034063]|uniref:peptidoglycan-binding domain-containing protein n=1 Tax=unclassified Lentzea TaxID=2643253 RepID=UPI0033E202DB